MYQSNKRPVKKINTFSKNLGKILKNPLTYSTLMLATVGTIYLVNEAKPAQQTELTKLSQTIDGNIAKNYNFHKFNLHTFKAEQKNEAYLLQLTGKAIKYPDQAATTINLTYLVDEQLYNTLNKTTFENTPEGKAAEYERFIDVMHFISALTKQKADAYEEYKNPSNAIQLSLNEFAIANITAPQVDAESNTVSFEIVAITNQELTQQDTSAVTLKTFKISAPLTPELANNPNALIAQYANGNTNFELAKEEKVTLTNFNTQSIQNITNSKSAQQNSFDM